MTEGRKSGNGKVVVERGILCEGHGIWIILVRKWMTFSTCGTLMIFPHFSDLRKFKAIVVERMWRINFAYKDKDNIFINLYENKKNLIDNNKLNKTKE